MVLKSVLFPFRTLWFQHCNILLCNSPDSIPKHEIIQVTGYLNANADIYNLDIPVVFHTGLRVGELSALKSSDIKGQIIQIKRTGVKYRDENHKWKVEVRDDTKTILI